MKKLQTIAEEIRQCRECRTGGTGLVVPGEGTGEAGIVFVGEAPGRLESQTGRPFVGRSGKLLRAMITGSGLDESAVFITSPVHYFPLSGRPAPALVRHGAVHLEKQIEAINPRIVVLLGNTAYRAIFGVDAEVAKQHGTLLKKGRVRYFLTYHPAYAMRFPEGRRKFAQDFEKLKTLIQPPEQCITLHQKGK